MGELDLIKWIRKRAKYGKSVSLGIGDDCAVIDLRNIKSLVITTDTILDGTHFIQKKCKPDQIGRKSITSSISDIAAMGCRPSYALVSFSFPENSDIKFCKDVFRGIEKAADQYNVQIIGGDVVSGNCPLNINVTAIGVISKSINPVKRSGAKPGDVIMVTGRLGGSILGSHLKFEPRIEEGVLLNEKFHVNSMIDISDGLLVDLNHIIEESNLGAIIDERQIPISRDAVKLSKTTKKSPIFHALTDGEDYELLFTVSEKKSKEISGSDLFNVPLTAIGYAKKEKGLFIKDFNGKVRHVKPKGYEHLV